jgi:hypothetical protein
MKGIRRIATLLVGFASLAGNAFAQSDAGGNQKAQPNWFTELLQERSKAGMMVDQHTSSVGSTYVPIDSWIYPALDRLQALGYIDFAYFGLRPWTRSSIVTMLNQTQRTIESAPNDGSDIVRTVRTLSRARQSILNHRDMSMNGRRQPFQGWCRSRVSLL